MSPLVLRKFLAMGVTPGTNVDTFTKFTYRVCTFDPHRMSEVAAAAVTLDLKTRFIHDN